MNPKLHFADYRLLSSNYRPHTSDVEVSSTYVGRRDVSFIVFHCTNISLQRVYQNTKSIEEKVEEDEEEEEEEEEDDRPLPLLLLHAFIRVLSE